MKKTIAYSRFVFLKSSSNRKEAYLGQHISRRSFLKGGLATAAGLAASSIAEHDSDFVREQLRRLQWLISEESGGVCWHAPEAMAEIVRNRPKLFADYISIVVTLVQTIEPEDLEHFRPGTLRAIGRLADIARAEVPTVLAAVQSALDDHNSQSRGMAVWCLGQLGMTELLADKPELETDQGVVELYDDGFLEQTTVAELHQRAINKRSAGGDSET